MILHTIPSGLIEQHEQIPRIKAQHIEAYYREQNKRQSKPLYVIHTRPIDLIYCALEVFWYTPEADFREASQCSRVL